MKHGFCCWLLRFAAAYNHPSRTCCVVLLHLVCRSYSHWQLISASHQAKPGKYAAGLQMQCVSGSVAALAIDVDPASSCAAASGLSSISCKYAGLSGPDALHLVCSIHVSSLRFNRIRKLLRDVGSAFYHPSALAHSAPDALLQHQSLVG